jgi:cytoskeleton protein RodZ
MNAIKNRHVFQVPLDYDEHANTTARDDSNIISLDSFKERDDKGNNYDSLIFGDSDDIDDSNNVVHIDTHADTTVHDLPKDTSDEKSADADMSPGARLRQVREQKNLSLQEIAEKVLLDVQVLKKLEANNYDGLPAPIFVRGYIKSYAKVLAIPQESILESFDRMNPQQKPEPIIPPPEPDKPVSSDDSWFNIGTIVLIVTFIVLLGWWYFYPEEPIPLSPELDESFVQPTPEEIQPEINEESWTAFQGNSQGTDEDEFEENSTQSELTSGTTIQGNPLGTDEGEFEENSTQSELTSGTTIQGNPQGTDEREFEETSTQSEQEPSPMPEPSIPVPEQPESTNLTEPVIPPDQTLRVHLGKKEVWMRITDSSGNKLFGGTAQAGETLNLTGKPPFYVQATRHKFDIEYQGETNGIKAYPNKPGQKNIFVVGSDE